MSSLCFSYVIATVMNTPVFMISGFFIIQFGMTSPVNIEKPKIKMFREEFISTYYKVINKVVSFCHFLK